MKGLNRYLFSLFLVLAVISFVHAEQSCEFVSVVDGYTLRVLCQDKEEELRLIGIDVPESGKAEVREPKILFPGRISAHTHLVKAGIWGALDLLEKTMKWGILKMPIRSPRRAFTPRRGFCDLTFPRSYEVTILIKTVCLHRNSELPTL
jgi:hypothetical protein